MKYSFLLVLAILLIGLVAFAHIQPERCYDKADRRAGRVPHVGKKPRARNKDSERWREKRSDAKK